MIKSPGNLKWLLMYIILHTYAVQESSFPFFTVINSTYRRWWQQSCWPSRCCPHEAPGWTGLPRRSGWCCAGRLPNERRCTPDQCFWWRARLNRGGVTQVWWGSYDRKSTEKNPLYFTPMFNLLTGTEWKPLKQSHHHLHIFTLLNTNKAISSRTQVFTHSYHTSKNIWH